MFKCVAKSEREDDVYLMNKDFECTKITNDEAEQIAKEQYDHLSEKSIKQVNDNVFMWTEKQDNTTTLTLAPLNIQWKSIFVTPESALKHAISSALAPKMVGVRPLNQKFQLSYWYFCEVPTYFSTQKQLVIPVRFDSFEEADKGNRLGYLGQVSILWGPFCNRILENSVMLFYRPTKVEINKGTMKVEK